MFEKKKLVYVHRGNGQARPLSTLQTSSLGTHDKLPVSHRARHLSWFLNVVFIVFLAGGGWYHVHTTATHQQDLRAQRESLEAEKSTVQAQLTRLTSTPVIKQLDAQTMANYFKQVSLAYVDTAGRPQIVGDEAADAYIRGVAESRGYSFWPVSDGQHMAEVDGFQLQEEAAVAWLRLRAAAARDGIDIRIVSGFRDYAEQRSLFLSRSGLSGYTTAQIVGRQADIAIDTALNQTSPPGYSRHHTGYTIDMADANSGGAKFATTKAYAWMSENNYAHATQFGWLPSYPTGATGVGPVPEPWEYVYVGVDALRAD